MTLRNGRRPTRCWTRRAPTPAGLANMSGGVAELADSTGFSPEGVTRAMMGLRNLETKLTPSDWAPESLFGEGGRIADLYGVMLNVPQLKRQLDEIRGEGRGQMRISEITRDWVNGKAIDAIGRKYFSRKMTTRVEPGQLRMPAARSTGPLPTAELGALPR